MSNELLTIDGAKNSMTQITTGLQIFDEKKLEIQQIVKEASLLSITSVDDKEGIKKVEETRKKLKALRIEAEKTGKGMRDLITPISKHISAKEKGITDLIEPEEQRLLSLERWVDSEKEKIKAERERIENEKLQKKIDAFSQYGYAVDIMSLKGWTDEQYDAEISRVKKEWEAEQVRIEDERKAAEAAKKEEEERIAKEREELAAMRAEQDRIRKEQEEKEEALREQQRKIDAEKKRIEDEKKAQEDRKQREIEMEAAKKEAAEKAVREAEEAAIKKKEEERLQKLEEERLAALAPKKEKLEAWVSSFEVPAAPIGMAEDKAVLEITAKFEAFKNWAAAKIENLK